MDKQKHADLTCNTLQFTVTVGCFFKAKMQREGKELNNDDRSDGNRGSTGDNNGTVDAISGK